MLITEEIVEKGARAEWDLEPSRPLWESMSASHHDTWKRHARACLTAALPDLIEAVERVPETCADARCASRIAGLREAADIADAHAKLWTQNGDHLINGVVAAIRTRITDIERE